MTPFTEPHWRPARWLFLAATLMCSTAQAQFNPARVERESAAVAARYADPDVHYDSPGFNAGRADFTSHAEALAYLDKLAQRTDRLRVEVIGQSQGGRAIVMAVLTVGGPPDPARPTVLILGQQHGNEPAGGEAALVLAAELLGARGDMLERVNVLIIPRANPDGAERVARTTANGIDLNRDHLLLRTPEARAIAAAIARFQPQVLLDLHEFTVGDRMVRKFGAVQKYDAQLQAATVGNLDPTLAAFAHEHYERPMHQALNAQGLSSFDYHTTTPDTQDKVLAMVGVQPDTGRNTGGLRPAVSMLLEVRGGGIGRAHFLRRVHTQVLAVMTAIEAAAVQGPELVKAVQLAGVASASAACQGALIIAAKHTLTRREVVMVDAVTGADKPITVDWRAATPLVVERSRPRPCGYLLAADQRDAVERLRWLGVKVSTVAQAARWQLEHYDLVGERGGQRQDARGVVSDGGQDGIRVFEVKTRAVQDVGGPGAFYIGLDQPMGALVAAALEPDSQSSYAANRLLDIDGGRLRRVTRTPPPALLTAP